MYRSLDIYLRDLDRELRLLPTDRRREIIQQLRGDYLARAAEQGESGFLSALPAPAELAREFVAEVPLKPAGYLRRLLAFALDILVMLVPVFAVLLALLRLGATSWSLALSLALGIITMIGIIILYFPLTEGIFGYSAGKYITGLLVVREDGRPCGIAKAFVRRIPFWFNLLFIDAIFMFFLPGRQRVFDRVAQTQVVKNPTKPPLWTYGLVAILLVAVGALTLYVGLGAADWFRGAVPPVPGPAVSVNQALELDLQAYNLVPGEMQPASTLDGEALRSVWTGPGREVEVTVYKGQNAKGMLALWVSGDHTRMSRDITFMNRGLQQYRTQTMLKYGWYDGPWTVFVTADRTEFSQSEFNSLVREISSQMAAKD